MELYAGAISAARREMDNIHGSIFRRYVKVYVFLASSTQEAKGHLLEMAEKEWPGVEGWQHIFSTIALSDATDQLLEQGITLAESLKEK